MLTELDAFAKGLCANCEKSVRVELSAIDSIKYKDTALCPECWISFITRKSLQNLKTPLQKELPLLGDMPKKISMGPLPLGTMVCTDSLLLRDCVINCIYRGPTCYFDVICPTQDSAQKIIEFLQGTLKGK